MFAVYTLGGEYGHITRACTLAAELSQARPDLATKLYLPEHGEGWARRLGLAFSCVPENVRCRRDLLSDWVAEALEADKPEVLIVDCFPIGLLGELESLLPSIKKKVFLTRWLHPRYISKEINRQTLQSFSLRLCTESLHRGFDHRGFENVGPILPCPPEEVLTRKEARLALGLDQDALIVWHQTTKSKTPGHYQEILETRSEELGYQLLQISPGSDLSQRAIPPARYLRAANLFVGQSGHQSYYEVIQAGVPAAFFPVDIPNDNQFQRAKGTYGPSHPQIHTPSLTEFSNILPQLLKADLQPIHPFCGAQTAAKKILDLLDQGE